MLTQGVPEHVLCDNEPEMVRSGSARVDSATQHQDPYRRLYRRRVVVVHIAVPGQASAPSWAHSGLSHSTLFGTASLDTS